MSACVISAGAAATGCAGEVVRRPLDVDAVRVRGVGTGCRLVTTADALVGGNFLPSPSVR
jgi:hypothetical protein